MAEQISVPKTAGLTEAQATEAIKRADLTVGGVNRANSDTVPEGVVTSSVPAGDAVVASGTPVTLTVSSGPTKVAVPSLVGTPLTTAEGALRAARLRLGRTTKAASATNAKGTIASTSPAAGTAVEPGSSVDVEVSEGAAQVAVPQMIGLTKLAAEATLRSAGLVPGAVTEERSSAVPTGGVSAQDPLPGTPVAPSSVVNMVVSAGAKPDWSERLKVAGFWGLGAILLYIIIRGLELGQDGFLGKLADEKTARGLITFLIAITTVGIAVILALSTVVLKDSDENDKRFDRGKQVLTILIGVLGTIVGFYFGSATSDQNRSQAPSPTQAVTIPAQALPAGTINAVYPDTKLQASGGTEPLTWKVDGLPAGLTVDPKTGVISGTPTTAFAGSVTVTVTDSSSPPKSGTQKLTLAVK